MQNNNNKTQPTQEGKAAPQNVSANTEEQARQKTEPIKGDEVSRKDQREGDMDNGELGAGLGE